MHHLHSFILLNGLCNNRPKNACILIYITILLSLTVKLPKFVTITNKHLRPSSFYSLISSFYSHEGETNAVITHILLWDMALVFLCV